MSCGDYRFCITSPSAAYVTSKLHPLIYQCFIVIFNIFNFERLARDSACTKNKLLVAPPLAVFEPVTYRMLGGKYYAVSAYSTCVFKHWFKLQCSRTKLCSPGYDFGDGLNFYSLLEVTSSLLQRAFESTMAVAAPLPQ